VEKRPQNLRRPVGQKGSGLQAAGGGHPRQAPRPNRASARSRPPLPALGAGCRKATSKRALSDSRFTQASRRKKLPPCVERHAEVARAQLQSLKVYNKLFRDHADQRAALRCDNGRIAYKYRPFLSTFQI